MKFYVKIHSRGNNSCIGVCDEDCLGKELRNGNMKYSVSRQFFEGELVSKEKALQVLRNCRNFNIVGKYICEAAVEQKYIHKDGIREIQGIPIAMKFVL